MRKYIQYKTFLICIGLIIAILIAYWQATDYQFINYDDPIYVARNHHVKKGFSIDTIKWVMTSEVVGNWHPVTMLSHILDSHFFGMDSGKHHLINILLHVTNTLILFFIFLKMTGSLWRCAFIAAFFALHPLHVETVAWVSERKDVLSTFFWLMTMWSYFKYTEKLRKSLYILAVVLFVLGLMSKPMLVTLPFVLLICDLWPLGRIKFNGVEKAQPSFNLNSAILFIRQNIYLVREKIPLFVLTIIFCIITFKYQTSGKTVVSTESISFAIRLINIPITYINYIWKLIWPYDLALLYPYADIMLIPGILLITKSVFALIVLIVVTVLSFRTAHQLPWFSFGWLWYLGTLVPVIGLVQVGVQSMADRYTYIPSIGLSIIVAWGIPILIAKLKNCRVWISVAAVTLFSLLTLLTWIQVKFWENSIKLFGHTLEVTHINIDAHINLGNALSEVGKIDEAITHYNHALKIQPDCADAHSNLGNALYKIGKVDAAITHYKQALETQADHTDAHINLGNALSEAGKTDEAITHFNQALKIQPDSVEAHNNMANALIYTGKLSEAVGYYTEALKIDPTSEEVHINLGEVLKKTGKTHEAIQHYKEALKLNPNNITVHINLAGLMLKTGKAGKAIHHYEEIIKITPGSMEAHNNLGNILLKTGKTDEAIYHYKAALKINSNNAETYNNLGSALKEQGKLTTAAKYFKEALRINPNLNHSHFNLGIICLQQERFTDAIHHFSESLRIKPDFAIARRNLNSAIQFESSTRASVKEITEKLKRNPHNPLLFYQLGNLYEKINEEDNAVIQYRKALAYQNNFTPALNRLAALYADRKDYNKSISFLKKVLEHQPENTTIYYNIACLYSVQNDEKKSIEWLKKAITNGYNNWALIKTDKDLENIRTSSSFKKIVEGK